MPMDETTLRIASVPKLLLEALLEASSLLSTLLLLLAPASNSRMLSAQVMFGLFEVVFPQRWNLLSVQPACAFYQYPQLQIG